MYCVDIKCLGGFWCFILFCVSGPNMQINLAPGKLSFNPGSLIVTLGLGETRAGLQICFLVSCLLVISLHFVVL